MPSILDALSQYFRDAAPGGALNPEVTRQGVLDTLAAASMPVPVVGDIAGLIADMNMYRNEPESRTPLNYGLTGLGLLPWLPNMTVFHGSPHRFDAFDMSKVGTGEGAQAYGHGLYFAEDPNVAGHYRDRLSTFDAYGSRRPKVSMVGDVPARDLGQDVWEVADQIASGGHGNVDGLIAHLKFKLSETSNPARADVWRDLLEQAERVSDDLRGKNIKFDSGSLYEVDIPDEAIAKMLDWDAPLSEQPESVRRVLDGLNFKQRKIGGMNVVEWDGKILEMQSDQITGREIYKLISGENNAARSAAWNDLGIPGIRYFDGTSRAAGEGTRNVVLFDDSLAKIISRK